MKGILDQVSVSLDTAEANQGYFCTNLSSISSPELQPYHRNGACSFKNFSLS